jgi:serine/threonine protein kinase
LSFTRHNDFDDADSWRDTGEEAEPMDWDQRLCILSSVVEAVESIHSLGPLSSHGNIKSTNVLLEDTHTAHLSEHGLGALRPFSKASASGYRAPEVTDHRHVSQKADVYSFGILMLELFTRKAPVDEARPEEGIDLLRLVSSVAREKWATQVLDTELRLPDGEMELISLQLLQLAIDCCSHNANVRPSMSDVSQLLQYFLEKAMISVAIL